MTPTELKAFRQSLCLTQTGLGQRLGPPGKPYALRTVQSWESGERGIPKAVQVLVESWKKPARK